MSRIPEITHQHHICVICEGLEEKIYFDRLLTLNVWCPEYKFIPVNAKGESNIFARFQDAYSKDCYEIVIIFCDTDKKPYREYSQLKKKVNDFFDKTEAAHKVILWANPCSMQIILSHFGEVHLFKQGKKTNSDIVEQLTGVRNYDAHEDQIREICNKIFYRTYSNMKERLREVVYDDEKEGTSNAVLFMERFENADIKWIAEINDYLSKD